MTFKHKILAAGLVAALGTGAGTAFAVGVSDYDPPVSFDLTFVFHIDDDLAEQDVFIEREPGSGQVYRPTKGERDLSKPLFTTLYPVAHTPFEPDNLGPWPKGKALGVTLGEWFAAEGKGRYTCENGEGHITIDFTSLVPNGVYTVWHAFMAWPPTEPFIGTYDLPMGARDGSQSVFTTDAAGNAVVERTFKPCLQLTGEHLAAELAIVYHSDGKTYGPLPGEFATDSHVHMYVGLPKRSGI